MTTSKAKIDWCSLKNDYLTTGISLRGLADKHNVSFNTIKKRAAIEKWAEEKKQIDLKITTEVTQATVNAVIEDKIKANSRHIELYDGILDVVQILLRQYLTELKEGKKRSKATAYSIDYLANALSKAQKGQRLALNLDNEDIGDVEPEILVIEGLDLDKI